MKAQQIGEMWKVVMFSVMGIENIRQQIRISPPDQHQLATHEAVSESNHAVPNGARNITNIYILHNLPDFIGTWSVGRASGFVFNVIKALIHKLNDTYVGRMTRP